MKRSRPTPHSVDSLREQLVNQRVRLWDWEAHRARTGGKTRGPCIAISRLTGSGATEIGERVARELGFAFFGNELVDRIAREGHVDRERVERLDERMRDPYERWVRDGFKRARYTEGEYLSSLLRALGAISEAGEAVVLGRGSPHVMPAQRTLRVLVVAPLEFRIARLAEETGQAHNSAAARVAYEDSQRSEFLTGHFGVSPSDAGLYDLVVNSQSIGIRNSADLVVEAAMDRFPEIQSSTAAARQIARPGEIYARS